MSSYPAIGNDLSSFYQRNKKACLIGGALATLAIFLLILLACGAFSSNTINKPDNSTTQPPQSDPSNYICQYYVKAMDQNKQVSFYDLGMDNNYTRSSSEYLCDLPDPCKSQIENLIYTFTNNLDLDGHTNAGGLLKTEFCKRVTDLPRSQLHMAAHFVCESKSVEKANKFIDNKELKSEKFLICERGLASTSD